MSDDKASAAHVAFLKTIRTVPPPDSTTRQCLIEHSVHHDACDCRQAAVDAELARWRLRAKNALMQPGIRTPMQVATDEPNRDAGMDAELARLRRIEAAALAWRKAEASSAPSPERRFGTKIALRILLDTLP